MKPDLPRANNLEISFPEKRFCLTGEFDGHARTALERRVVALGGTVVPNVDRATDYLIVGSQGTRCCSFSCCARVVEKAVELARAGARLRRIEEADFIAALGRLE